MGRWKRRIRGEVGGANEGIRMNGADLSGLAQVVLVEPTISREIKTSRKDRAGVAVIE